MCFGTKEFYAIFSCPCFRFGFHQPPVNSVDHLHLHCLALPFEPRSAISFVIVVICLNFLVWIICSTCVEIPQKSLMLKSLNRWRCVKYLSLGPLGGFIEAEKLLERIKPVSSTPLKLWNDSLFFCVWDFSRSPFTISCDVVIKQLIYAKHLLQVWVFLTTITDLRDFLFSWTHIFKIFHINWVLVYTLPSVNHVPQNVIAGIWCFLLGEETDIMILFNSWFLARSFFQNWKSFCPWQNSPVTVLFAPLSPDHMKGFFIFG